MVAVQELSSVRRPDIGSEPRLEQLDSKRGDFVLSIGESKVLLRTIDFDGGPQVGVIVQEDHGPGWLRTFFPPEALATAQAIVLGVSEKQLKLDEGLYLLHLLDFNVVSSESTPNVKQSIRQARHWVREGAESDYLHLSIFSEELL